MCPKIRVIPGVLVDEVTSFRTPGLRMDNRLVLDSNAVYCNELLYCCIAMNKSHCILLQGVYLVSNVHNQGSAIF